MDDLISRQAVKEWLKRWDGYLDQDMITRMQLKVDDIPTHPTPSNTLGALDCIDRQAAIEDAKEAFKRNPTMAIRVMDLIKSMPSVQPRKGKWINIQHSVTGDSSAECDQCWAIVHDNFLSSSINFCPNCGARMDMRGEQDDN